MLESIQGTVEGKLQPDREGAFQGLSPSGFHNIAYADWGPVDDKRPVVCVHGLTRGKYPFDFGEHEPREFVIL